MKRIAVLPGDGIGPEVVAEALRVLRVVAPGLSYQEFSVGAGEYLRSGDPLPEETFAAIRECDAILLGAMGLPAVRWPDGREMTPQIDLREKLDLYCGVRPIYLWHGEDSPLRGRKAGDIDLVMLRESTEGLFASRMRSYAPSASEVRDELLVTRRGAERIVRRGFEMARTRRRKVALIDKANVLPSMVYFRAIFEEIALAYPDVEATAVYVDAAALYLVERPEMFDVMILENLFGDILSDLGAGIVGGMGMAPSADLGEPYGVFQPSHGTAPTIAGQGIANPIATILSAAMMLDWLGLEGGERVRAAVRAALSVPERRTRDRRGSLSTKQMTDVVLEGL
jgi:3-isopropylmalate dehydrogenase